MKKDIVIHLQTKSDPSGIVNMSGHLNGLGKVAGKVGEAFGGATTYIGQFAQNLLRGGIWEAGAAILGFAVKKAVEFATASARAEKEAMKAAKEAHDARMKAVDEYAAALDKVAKTREASISSGLKLLNDEVDATKELTKATLELEKAEARKRGDAGRMTAIDREMDAVDAEAARERLGNEIEAARRRQDGARDDYRAAEAGRGNAAAAADAAAAALAGAVARVRERAAKSAVGAFVASQSVVGGLTALPATAEDRAAAADKAEAEFRKGDEYRQLAERVKAAKDGAANFADRMDAAKRAIEEAAAAERNLGDRLEAVNVRQEAKERNAEADAAEAARKRAEEVAAAERKAAQDAARERDRLDRELHQKRMADLRAEIDEQARAAAPLRAVASAAQGEFDRAFALYRDPARAEAAVAEEKAYAADLDRLHADASRYGGKWRIDELSRLMAAGDTAGQAAALAEWRRSGRFTPEVEAMVRASAAERTKTTAEDELRKIAANTSGLAEKLDELIGMKGGE